MHAPRLTPGHLVTSALTRCARRLKLTTPVRQMPAMIPSEIRTPVYNPPASLVRAPGTAQLDLAGFSDAFRISPTSQVALTAATEPSDLTAQLLEYPRTPARHTKHSLRQYHTCPC